MNENWMSEKYSNNANKENYTQNFSLEAKRKRSLRSLTANSQHISI
jgi:hypothetical protein